MGSDKIVTFYVMRIKNGFTTLDAVPTLIRVEVESVLNNETVQKEGE